MNTVSIVFQLERLRMYCSTEISAFYFGGSYLPGQIVAADEPTYNCCGQAAGLSYIALSRFKGLSPKP